MYPEKKTSPVKPRLKKEIKNILKQYQMPAESKGNVFEVQLPSHIKKLSNSKAISRANDMNIKYHLYSMQRRTSRKNPVIRIRRILVLRDKNNEWIVWRRGQNPFRDPGPEKLVGQPISAEGELVKNIFFISNWKEILK
jgi:hypothetical protein